MCKLALFHKVHLDLIPFAAYGLEVRSLICILAPCKLSTVLDLYHNHCVHPQFGDTKCVSLTYLNCDFLARTLLNDALQNAAVTVSGFFRILEREPHPLKGEDAKPVRVFSSESQPW